MTDPLVFYLRLVEDLKKMSPRDPCLIYELKEAKREVDRLLLQTKKEYYDGLILMPEIMKCPRCGMIL
jgi:hypothetical protein